MKKKILVLGAVLVIAAMLCVQGMENSTNNMMSKNDTTMTTHTMSALHTPNPTTNTLGMGTDILVSGANTDGDDIHPRMCLGAGYTIVTYEQHISTFEVSCPIVYSNNNGNTWTTAYDRSVTDGSGLLYWPDIVYCPTVDQFFWDCVDPIGESFNLKMSMIPGNIAAAEDAPIYQVSGVGAADHYGCAVMYVDDIMVTPYICDEPDYGIDRDPCIGYWQGDTFEHPPNIGGFYYDGQSEMASAPALYMEGSRGSDRMYMVMETEQATKNVISWKATTTDLDLLLTAGGGPGGMDKYADIEVWPWFGQFEAGEANAQDPDVSGSGTNVVIVYMSNDNIYGDWDITCQYSSDSGDSWASTVFGTPIVDETHPAVLVSGSTVFITYVSNGNLYLIKSDDGGATFGDPEQVNDNPGSVVAEEGTTDISTGGIVWTDNRDGVKNIYYASLPIAILDVSIAGGFGVTGTVSNSGSAAASNIPWTVDLSGLVFVGGHSEGTIASLAPGASETFGPGLILGIGPTTITADAGGATKTASGFVLGPMVLGL
jgi:hypothetical protein